MTHYGVLPRTLYLSWVNY